MGAQWLDFHQGTNHHSPELTHPGSCSTRATLSRLPKAIYIPQNEKAERGEKHTCGNKSCWPSSQEEETGKPPFPKHSDGRPASQPPVSNGAGTHTKFTM